MSDIALLALGLFGSFGLGLALAFGLLGSRLISASTRPGGFLVARAELLGLGAILGIPAMSTLQFAWSLSGGSLGREFSLVMSLVGLVSGIASWVVVRRFHRQSTHSGSDTMVPLDGAAEGWAFARLSAAIALLLVLFAMVQALLTPQKFWDERAYYGLKAIVLFEDQTVRSADWREPDFVQGHPRYPLLLSLAEQHLYAMLGRVDDRLVKVLFPILFAGLVFTFAGVLSRHMAVGRAWLAALLLATVPVLLPDDYGVICGQADAPVACLEGVAILYLWDSLLLAKSTGDRTIAWLRSLLMGAVVSSFTAFTKDEGISHGMIHGFCFLAGLATLSWGPKGLPVSTSWPPRWARPVVAALIYATVVAVLLGPWLVHRRELPMTGEMNYFGRMTAAGLWNGLGTLNWSVPHLAYRMFAEARTWGLQWWLVGLAVILFPRRLLQAPHWFLLGTLCGDLAALLLAGMIAPITLEEHIGGSSHRYLMQLAPGGVLLAVSMLWTETLSDADRT